MTAFPTSITLIWAILLTTLQTVQPRIIPDTNGGFEFIILHNNDMHARFDQTGRNSVSCSPKDMQKGRCYGGFARTANVIRRYREQAKQPGGTPVLYLNAGDTYSGTSWFAIFKDKITSILLNALEPDAISLGNHEFDDGIEGLVPFIENARFPILAANLDLSKTPEMANLPRLQNSTILTVAGNRVGIVGYLTPQTKVLNRRNNIEYLTEIEAINRETEKLKAEGIDIIIALGHSGYDTDQEIARFCPDVDIVVGGHTNTFLYTGTPPDIEKPQGLYPTVIEQDNGKKVPVVQAYAFTKYLGYIKLKFDTNGTLLEWEGNPILLDSSVPQDQDILDILNIYRPNVTAAKTEVLGKSKVILDASRHACRKDECNLGNMVADSMIYARIKELEPTSYKFWTDAAIAFVQAGALRSSIERKPNSTITRNDILSVLPFGNALYVVKVPGHVIRTTLEYSATKYDLMESNGGYLQMAGVRVVYDMTKPLGERVISVEALCAECLIPEYRNLDDRKTYKIIISSFLLMGGDGHSIVDKENPLHEAIDMGITDTDAAAQYIRAKEPLE
ncbi:unnamed protein product [Hermetia illucens]|uniref:5'-nucleotidase n=1 Tax=Hermetia illucens TaxID=343691 RepID=A0A7R8UXV5_HERIL|nr:unnamed protein product [Hermetia illucens]